jgi:hypothetical protein
MPNNFQPHVPNFQRGERLSAARLNELADAIAKLLWQKQQSANAAFGVRAPLEIIGKLDDDLPAATDFGTAPGEAVMSVWFKDQNGNLIDSGRNENIKQRFESAEAKSAGDEVRAAWIEGEWVALPTGSGGGHTMWFTIVDVLCPDGYEVTQKTLRVTPLWYTGNCGKVPPGRQDDGYWHVYDICSYLSGHVDEELPTTLGRATYYYPYTADDYDPPACVPAWILSDLCAQPEC